MIFRWFCGGGLPGRRIIVTLIIVSRFIVTRIIATGPRRERREIKVEKIRGDAIS